MIKNKIFSIVVAVLAWGVLSPSVFADIPNRTVQCNCEQVGIATTGPLSEKVNTQWTTPANVWITSVSGGNMSVTASLTGAGAFCTVLQGQFEAYPASERTMPINYPITIQCGATAINPSAQLSITACTPMQTCGTKTVPVSVHQ